MNSFNYWQLLAGISAFIFSMSLLEGSIKSLSGRAFKKFLQKQTAGKFRALLTGTFITAILQSSSVVVLMTLSFVGAGLVPLRNALAVVLGSNLGTTVNSWIIAYAGFKMELNAFAYPVMALCLTGFLLFPKNKSIRSFSTMLFGMALMFIGLQWMKDSAPGLQQTSALKPYLNYSPYWFLLIGFVITVILQSSSVTFALSLTGIQSGLFPVSTAAFMVIGAELGTTIKVVMGALNGSSDQKRLAAANFSFNLATLVITVFFVSPLLYFLQHAVKVSNSFMLLAAFQSTLNLLSIALFYPWLGAFSDIIEKLFKDTRTEAELKFIGIAPRTNKEDLLADAENEIRRLLRHSLEFNQLVIVGPQEDGNKRIRQLWQQYFQPVSRTETYERVKLLQAEILDFLADLIHEELPAATEARCSALLTATRYILVAAKHIKDIQHNIDELHTTSNDDLYSIHRTIRNDEQNFLTELQLLFAGSTDWPKKERIETLQQENKKRQTVANQQVLDLMAHNRIPEINGSTLLNLHRAIYSSHHTLLNALMKLSKSKEE